MKKVQSSFYGQEIPDRVEKALDRLMKAFVQANNAKTKEERNLARTILAKAREEYRKVVDEAFRTEVLAIA